MGAMASQITSLTIIYSTFYLKNIKARIIGLCAGNSPVADESPHKWPVTREMFTFDDVIM